MGNRKVDTKVTKIIDRYTNKLGAVISILEDIQEAYGYLPKEVLEEVSEKLHVHLSQLFSLATFYSAFTLKPRGEHTVQICLGTACHVRGAPKVLDEFSRILHVDSGDTTDDGKFTLESVRCIGCCSLAPVITVDKEIHGYNTMNNVSKLLEKFKEKK
ncbi:MAG: NADH-quinone oxidoreductase subunit NuoE [Deltaproteobacteria bacterium]|nr:NADH-quinone oxidoreductase subunit NuoE [Deltaproteobacteria bacterium]